ncbi:proline-rich receptor-like protein kinase PERK2 [Vigna umbellata]|uniref:proline-rich receptor-like protein kinase PERK2 n=1 Tax=Vigna umbellata TaxID=87088 RepID=UPI001F5FCFAB|nr:proline-rich receptor-like protein kinase PERK2 [Vigna umbellata]
MVADFGAINLHPPPPPPLKPTRRHPGLSAAHLPPSSSTSPFPPPSSTASSSAMRRSPLHLPRSGLCPSMRPDLASATSLRRLLLASPPFDNAPFSHAHTHKYRDLQPPRTRPQASWVVDG